MEDFPDSIDPEKQTRFLEFKKCVQKHLVPGKFEHEDIYLRKWLVARDWDVQKAVDMFNAHQDFRKELNLDDLDNWKVPEVVEKFYCGGVVGFDKDGRPMKLAVAGLDLKGLMHSCYLRDLRIFKARENEQVVRIMEEQTKKLGKPILQMLVLYDMDNTGASMLWRPAMNFQITMMKLLEDNYPELIYKMIIVNAPAVFPIIWKMARPFISEATKNKISVFGRDYKEALLELVDAEELPVHYGGTKTDSNGDPRCSALVGQAGTVPENYYLTELSNTENLQKVNVVSGDTVRLRYKIEKRGTMIKWEFKTKEYDIGFAIEREDHTQNRHLVMRSERYNSHIAPEFGNLVCHRPGTYHLIFDNTFSWTRSKQVQYYVEVVDADDAMTTEVTEMNFETNEDTINK